MRIDPANLNRRDMHELLVAVIMPRPIAWVSTVGKDGVFNLAPFSMFTNVSLKPPIICLGIGWRRDGQKKDTLRNIEWSKDFVINVVDESLAEAMNQTSAEYPAQVDEFQEVGLTPVKGEIVKAPVVAESPISMECMVRQVLEFGEKPGGGCLILGEVVRFHVRDEFYVNGQMEVSKLKHIGRLGGQFYCRITDTFEMERPYIL
jgi:flavin reductase (DIM6/NTAB) family NADH-FMN oxidoreductase RutF